MTTATKLGITMTLLIVLGGLGAADYFLTGDEYGADLLGQESTETGSGAAMGIAKSKGPDVLQTIKDLAFAPEKSDDLTLLAQVVAGTDAEVKTAAILQNVDRIGSVAWVESPDVKNIFVSLKEALLTAFSPQMHDLRDETLLEEGKPVRNLLTFVDPALSEERIVFLRVRERLYEFHIASDKEEQMNLLIEALTSR